MWMCLGIALKWASGGQPEHRSARSSDGARLGICVQPPVVGTRRGRDPLQPCTRVMGSQEDEQP